MKTIQRVLSISGAIVVLSSFFCGPRAPQALCGEEIKTLKREMDPVVITGAQCPGFQGNPIENYGLYALRSGALVPIPFQIDEVDGTGHFVLTNGKGKGQDSDKRLFDANDELVFMAVDTGDRLVEPGFIPGPARGCMELLVTDPLSGEKGWVYLMTFSTPPPRSKVEYVRYEPPALKVTARNYLAQFNKRFPAAPDHYAFTRTIGGDETNIIDRIKIRIHMKLLAAFDRTEEDVSVNEIGYINGPVRAIVRARQSLNLVFGVPATRTVGDTIYYYSHIDFPFIVDLPLRPSVLRILVYDDFVNLAGWIMYSSTNPKGHTLDAVMDDKDKEVDRSPWKWLAVSDGRLAFWSMALYPPGCPVHARLYYNDDRTARNPPERVPGEVPGLGWDFGDGWDKAAKFPLEFRLLHFFTKGYVPGDENGIVNIHDHPLMEEVKILK